MNYNEFDIQRLSNAVIEAIAKPNPEIIPWAEESVQFPAGVKGRFFRISLAPWLREPLLRGVDDETRSNTLVKPVQTGGSALGEVLLCYWLSFWRGFIQYNWSNDKRADERWASRIQDLLLACAPVASLMDRYGYQKCEFGYGRGFFRMQGVFEDHNLDSDSISIQLNEEVHDWKPGMMAKADGRFTAVLLYKQVNISNAGVKGDQLDKKFRAGTMQYWEALCPFCSNPNHPANVVRHRMRTKWDDRRPDLGGLRYDATDARLGKFVYDYNKLRPTIQYQFPCGGVVHNQDVSMRRRMSEGGEYSGPTNSGAELAHRSYTYDSVIVHDIDWMMLIQKKHEALRSRLLGDNTDWIKYTQERECVPYDPEDIPAVYEMKTTAGLKKSREGLPPPRLRACSIDRQQGDRSKGETPYWWAVIRDFKVFFGVLRSVLVGEGRFETDEQLVGWMDEHEVERYKACADSGDDTDHVYNFCYRYGVNAIKGGKHMWYTHDDGARRSYSPPRPLCEMMTGFPPKYPKVFEMDGDHEVEVYDDREPMFWLYSKAAIAERLHWLRSAIQYETPDDVSDEYIEHHDAEERVIEQLADGTDVVKWIQRKRRNEALICERYNTMILDMSGAIGEAEIKEVQSENKSK